MKKIIVALGAIIIIAIIIIRPTEKQDFSVESFKRNNYYIFLIDNKSSDVLDLNLYLDDKQLNETCKNLFPNQQGTIVVEAKNDLDNYSVKATKKAKVKEFTDYDENININLSKDTVDVTFTKNNNDNYTGCITMLLYQDDKIIDVITKDVVFDKQKIIHSFDIPSDVDEVLVKYRFW